MHEMSRNFVEELQLAIDRFETAILDYSEKKDVRVAATASIEETVDKAMDTVFRLAGIVPNKIRKNQQTLKEWELARRVHGVRVSKSAEPEPSASTEAVPATAT